jgi:5-deoxy-glucuronate isomerase
MSIYLPSQGEPVAVTPDAAGWTFSGLQIVQLEPGVGHELHTGDAEYFVLPLQGSVAVDVDESPGGDFQLDGRDSVFAGPSDFCYLGRDSGAHLVSTSGALVALPSARCDTRRPARYGSATNVPVEARGAGPATRQVRNFGTPDAWAYAERLMCCEVITPPGNWSSYPPHKHDPTDPCQVANEEIYYYRIAGDDQLTPSRTGFGLHRTYTAPEHADAGLAPLDELVEVRDGDVVLIPYGYHGPCVAAPGYPMYYLNVLAGPGPTRSMAFCDDPAHAWIRDSWAAMPIDPRIEAGTDGRST